MRAERCSVCGMDVSEIIERLGGPVRAADALGLKRSTVSMWKAAGRVPLRHVPAVASALGVPNETIWPALGAHQVAA